MVVLLKNFIMASSRVFTFGVDLLISSCLRLVDLIDDFRVNLMLHFSRLVQSTYSHSDQ